MSQHPRGSSELLQPAVLQVNKGEQIWVIKA